MLVKNLQSKYRDLSVFWFMNKSNMEAVEAFIATHRFYTVVYAIEWEQEQVQENTKHQDNLVEECTKKPSRDTLPCSYASVLKGPPPPSSMTAHALLAPVLVTVMEVQETIKKFVEEDSGSKTTHCDSWSDSGSHGTLSSYDTHEIIPTTYRGGSYNKTEFENVREYYQKWGRDRMFVMFGTRGEVFGRNDKQSIRNLLNNVLRDQKYQELRSYANTNITTSKSSETFIMTRAEHRPRIISMWCSKTNSTPVECIIFMWTKNVPKSSA
jgi:hypothetical protein